MRTSFDVMLLDSNKSLSRQGLRCSLTQRVAMPSFFLHRTSAVHMNLFVASTTPWTRQLCWSGSASVPAEGNKASKLLTGEICGGWGGRRNSQSHRRISWGDPKCPRPYTSPPTWESAPEGPNLLVDSGGSDWKLRAEQAALFPLGPIPHIQRHNAVTWVAPPWWTPKALPLTM